MKIEKTNSNKNPTMHYDALHDKFANYYFQGQTIKQHLTRLKKVQPSATQILESQTNHQHEQQYLHLITHKLNALQHSEKAIQTKIRPYQ